MATLPTDTQKSGIEGFIRSIFGPRVDYLASWPCRVVSQNADGSLELQPDDQRWSTLSHIPIHYGVPGVTATVAAGARVTLEFAGGDPSRPQATVWESASVTKLTVDASLVQVNGGTAPVARVGDSVAQGTAMALWMHQVEVALNLLAGGTVVPLSTTFGLGSIASGAPNFKA